MQNFRIFNPKSDLLKYEFTFNPKETSSIHNELNNKANPSLDDIRRIALWKLDRVIDVPDSTLKILGKLATSKNLTHRSDISKLSIELLVECEGIGYPMASTIMKFIRPDTFPIIDVRAYRALKGKKLYFNNYNLDLYLDYVDELKKLSEEFNMPLSAVDEQLYCFDKKYNEKI